MKHLIAIILFSVSFMQSGTSQFSIKAFAGMNSAWHLSESDIFVNFIPQGVMIEKSSNVLLPFVGVQVQIHNQFDRPLDFNFEGQITYKGRSEKEFDYTLKILYAEFTPSVDIEIYNQIRIALGPYVGKQLITFDNHVPGLFRGFVEDWDFGGMASISYSFKKLLIRLNYYHGRHSIDGSDQFSFSRVKVYNRIVQLGLGYNLFTKERKEKPHF